MNSYIFKPVVLFVLLLSVSNIFAQILPSISGMVRTPGGDGVSNATLVLSDNQGNQIASVTTGADGLYTFTDLFPGFQYNITLTKNDAPLNGVTTFDQVIMVRHILGVAAINSPYYLIATDVNNSQSLTTFDAVLLRRVVLGISNEFPVLPWRFLRADYTFNNPANPFAEANALANTFVLNGNLSGFDFIGIKTGDTNDSAIP